MKIISFIAAALLLSACGQDRVVQAPAQPSPSPGPTPTTPSPGTGDKLSYAQMQTQLVTYCQACHSSANFMTSETALKSSQAKDYLWSRRMPPSNAPKALPDEVRVKMLSFF